MPVRVTQNMLNTQLLRNLSGNLLRTADQQNQLATGRKINKPSDDPVGISFSMRYRSDLSSNDQYQKNADGAYSWIDYADTMMSQTGEVLQRVRELAVQGANGSNPQMAMDSIKSEIDQLQQQLIGIGNSQFNGKYVFNGQLTDIKPYSTGAPMDDVTDNGIISFEIGAGVTIPVNVTGNDVFGNPGDADNAFKVIDDISKALSVSDYQGVSAALAKLDSRMDSFLAIRAEVGAISNRIELSQGRLQDVNTNLQSLQSKTEDADVAGVITNLKTSQNVYQASLSVGAKLISTSLMDFLR